jgi:hypothetical protein
VNKILVGTMLVVGLPLVFLKFRESSGGALVLLIALVVVSDSLWSWRIEGALRTQGEEAVVTPAGDSYTKITRRSSEKIRMAVKFRTARGEEVSEETELPPGVLQKFLRGERVTVTYLASKPTQYRFNPWSPTAPGDLKFGAFLMALSAAWIFVKRRMAPKASPQGEMDTVR